MSKTSHTLVAQKLRALRKAANKSQFDVAHHLGIGQQAYSSYETGRVGIPIRSLIKICDYFAVDMETFLLLYGAEEFAMLQKDVPLPIPNSEEASHV